MSLPPEVKLRIETFIGGRHVWGPINAAAWLQGVGGSYPRPGEAPWEVAQGIRKFVGGAVVGSPPVNLALGTFGRLCCICCMCAFVMLAIELIGEDVSKARAKQIAECAQRQLKRSEVAEMLCLEASGAKAAEFHRNGNSLHSTGDDSYCLFLEGSAATVGIGRAGGQAGG